MDTGEKGGWVDAGEKGGWVDAEKRKACCINESVALFLSNVCLGQQRVPQHTSVHLLQLTLTVGGMRSQFCLPGRP